MKPVKTVEKILNICRDTPEFDSNKDPNIEAQRLDDVITVINDLCDNCINDPLNENEFDDA
jgi:hypothetical protein